MSILFINGSPDKSGNTVRLARTTLDGRPYDTLTLVDYKLYSYGQHFPDDQLSEILEAMDAADTIIVGSPVYWHNLSGSVRNLLDRLYGAIDHSRFEGKRMCLLYQGAAPAQWMMDAGEYSINKFCELYGLDYLGMATTADEAKRLGRKL